MREEDFSRHHSPLAHTPYLAHSAERTRSLAWKIFLGIIPPYLAPADWEASLGQSRAQYSALLEKHTPALEAAEAEYARRSARESDCDSATRHPRYPFWFADLMKDLPRIRLMVTTAHELRRSRRSAAERKTRHAARAEAARRAQSRPRTPPSTPCDRSPTRCESPTPHFRPPPGGGGDGGGDDTALDVGSESDSFHHMSDDDVFEEMLLDYDEARAAMPNGVVSGTRLHGDGDGGASPTSPTSPSPRPLQTRNAFGSEEVRAKMKRILFCWTAEHADGVQSEGALGYVQGMQDLLGVLFFAVHADALPPDDDVGDGVAADAPTAAGSESPATRRRQRMRGRRVGGDVEKAGRSLLGALLDPDFIEHDAYLLFTALMVHAWPLFDMEVVAPASPSAAAAAASSSARGASSDPGRSGGAAAGATPPVAEQPLCFALCSLAQRSVLPLLEAGLAAKLQRLEVEPTMFMVKWLLPLFRRELPTRGVLRLWDCLLASCLAVRLDQGAAERMLLPARGASASAGLRRRSGTCSGDAASAAQGGAVASGHPAPGSNIVTRIAQRAQQDISNLARGFEDGVNKGTSAFGGRITHGGARRDSMTTLDGRNLALTHGAFVSTAAATSLEPSPLLSTAVLIAVAMLQRSLGDGSLDDDDMTEGARGGGGGGEAARRAPRPSGGGDVDGENAQAEERLMIMQVSDFYVPLRFTRILLTV